MISNLHTCFDLYRNNKHNENVNLNGRKGQNQDGVDIFGRKKSGSDWFGLQCKVRATGKLLTKTDLLEEIKKAELFNPRLNEYYVITTLSRNSKMQESVRKIIQNRKMRFKFDVIFWEDISAHKCPVKSRIDSAVCMKCTRYLFGILL